MPQVDFLAILTLPPFGSLGVIQVLFNSPIHGRSVSSLTITWVETFGTDPSTLRGFTVTASASRNVSSDDSQRPMTKCHCGLAYRHEKGVVGWEKTNTHTHTHFTDIRDEYCSETAIYRAILAK